MSNCIFCDISTRVASALIVYENDKYICFLDKYPQTRGHLQLIPKKHYEWIHELPSMGEIFALAQKIIHGIIPVLGANHVSIGTFGQEVSHAHVWIVPRYHKGVRVKEGLGKKAKINDQINLQAKLSRVLKEVY